MTERSVAPLCVGPANCEIVTGLPWRHLRDHAQALGLKFVSIGAKRVLLADDVRRVLELMRGDTGAPANDEADNVTELAAMRSRTARASA